MVDRRVVFPDFDAARVVYDDDALLVVDKPAGVPSQAAEEGASDDLVSRLRAFFGLPYLGVHQRLDRATSGLIAYAKKREANKSLASQFEGRAVEKRYVALVTGFRGGARTLRHRLGNLVDGVVPVLKQGGQEAVTRVSVLEKKRDRALLELVLETGRTHQARAQLAAEGSPIAGDALYGGAPSPRLMLHAAGLRLRHPIDDRPLSLHRDPPRAFARWLEHGDVSPIAPFDREAFDDALEVAREERFALGRSSDTTAFRLINEGGDGLPGLAVDVYGDHLIAQFYGDDPQNPVLDALESLGFAGIYLKIRPKQANVIGDARTERFAPSAAVRGQSADPEIEIREHGVPYLARLGDGLSTGIFLDQRENRRRVRSLAAGKRVLNLFAYTCPFTIAAASGGASRTVSVDAAKPAIDRGIRGLAHAGLAGDHHAFVIDDVFDWLDRARRKSDRFDLVILDPPSYSTVGKTRFSTSSDYRSLAALAMAVVAKDGQLLACSNHRQTVQAKLRRLLHEAAREAGRTVVQMKDLPFPADFPAPIGREPHLKSILVRLA
ncbi:MAG: class I SAM-dependent methyltransferase [Polyangiales bacterium]